MSTDNLIGLIIVGSLLGIGGFVMILSSWLMRHGSVDTNYYHIIVNSHIYNFLVAGSILFGFGLLSVALIYYKLQIIKE